MRPSASTSALLKAADKDLHLSFWGSGEESIILGLLWLCNIEKSCLMMKKAELLLFMLAGQEKKKALLSVIQNHCHSRKLALIETNHASKSV